MKKKKLLLFILAMILIFIGNIAYASNIDVSFETEKNTYLTTAKITSDKKMNVVKFYKKAENGKYILFYVASPKSKSLECKIKSTFFSTEKETDIKVVITDDEGVATLDKKFSKLPKMPDMNPEEKEKPSWSPVPIPSKTNQESSSSEQTKPESEESNSTQEITGIKLNKNSVTLKVGEKDKLTYTITPEGAKPHLKWRTEANDICSIEEDGTITGVSAGDCEISIKADNGVKDVCFVKVVKVESDNSSSNQNSGNNNSENNNKKNTEEELRNKLVEVAKKEVGNTNGQKYLKYFNTTQAPGGWCSEFASWCANECGYVEKGIIPKKDGCGDFSKWFKNKGRFKDRNYIPKPGDICFTGGNNVSHTCIVVAVDEEKGKFYTVDGGSKVTKNTRTLKESDIYGFGVPDYESIAN